MNETALITGASSGIGKEFANIHAARGGDLIAVARSGDKLAELRDELEKKHGITVKIIEKDLTATSAAREIFDEIESEGIAIRYLINNAGFGGIGKFHERELDDDLNMIQLNVVALTELTRLFLPGMVERNSGSILNVSSTASLLPGPLQAVYYATKAYVTSFSNALWEELRETNVTVTALLPGATETDFGKVSGMDKTEIFESTASPKTVASDGYEAMLSGKLEVVSGLPFALKLMMVFQPFIPKKVLLKQIHKMQKTDD